MFNSYSQADLIVHNMSSGRFQLLKYKDQKGNSRELVLENFKTEHQEIGHSSDTKGLAIEFSTSPAESRLVILGDTAYEAGIHRSEFISRLADSHTKIVVLHIGSSQLKQRVGGHLYLMGLNRLLTSIGEELVAVKRPQNDKLLVIISEWGFEHATGQQIKKISPGVKGFDSSSPIIETIDFLKSGLANLLYDKRMTVIPGDIGLMVGIESRKVYWKDKNGIKSANPDALRWRTNDDGIEYFV
jgi:hypothetical protein